MSFKVVLFALVIGLSQAYRYDDLADADRTVPQIIRSRGFISQTHEIETKDGYYLHLHRIVMPNATSFGKPVVLHHGLFGASSDWVITEDGPYLADIKAQNINITAQPMGNNLAFELALRGYDVWLPNSRGNRYSSQKHKYLDVNSKKFWEFSMDEKIKYDVPSTVAYILKETNSTTIAWVGHSQGTMIMFGALSRFPKLNNVIKPFIALAPVTNIGHLRAPLRVMANGILLNVVKALGGPFTATARFTRALTSFCPAQYRANLCTNAIFLTVGFNERQLNTNRLKVYLSHTPAGTSWRNLVHFAQNIRSDRFSNFDEGILGNRRVYGQADPPEYDVTKITNKYINLVYSDNDWLTVPQDVLSMARRLTVQPRIYRVSDPNWNHLDFIWGREAGYYVYTDVLKILNQQA